MKQRFNAVQKSCGWPVIYQQASELYGAAAADDLLRSAEALYTKYRGLYSGCTGIRKLHILSAAAFGSLYLPLKEKVGSETAVRMMEEAAKPASAAKHNKIEKMPAVLFIKVAGLITSVMFGEKAGFQRRWHSNTAKEKRFDLLTCPYVEVLQEMGCPEVCPAICIQDDYSFSGMKNGVRFERKKTLGRGDDCCDFCYRIPDKNTAENTQAVMK